MNMLVIISPFAENTWLQYNISTTSRCTYAWSKVSDEESTFSVQVRFLCVITGTHTFWGIFCTYARFINEAPRLLWKVTICSDLIWYIHLYSPCNLWKHILCLDGIDSQWHYSFTKQPPNSCWSMLIHAWTDTIHAVFNGRIIGQTNVQETQFFKAGCWNDIWDLGEKSKTSGRCMLINYSWH